MSKQLDLDVMVKMRTMMEKKISYLEEFIRSHARQTGVICFWIFLPMSLPLIILKGLGILVSLFVFRLVKDAMKFRYLFELVLDCMILRFEILKDLIKSVHDSKQVSDGNSNRKYLPSFGRIDKFFTKPFTNLLDVLSLSPNFCKSTMLVNTGLLLKKPGSEHFGKLYFQMHGECEESQSSRSDDDDSGHLSETFTGRSNGCDKSKSCHIQEIEVQNRLGSSSSGTQCHRESSSTNNNEYHHPDDDDDDDDDGDGQVNSEHHDQLADKERPNDMDSN